MSAVKITTQQRDLILQALGVSQGYLVEIVRRWRRCGMDITGPRESLLGVIRAQSPLIDAAADHDAGAIARCSKCRRYTVSWRALGPAGRRPICECGLADHWSGSFEAPGPDAKWALCLDLEDDPC